MSDFIQQYSYVSNFDSANSWVILSPIEQNIKEKIEKIGTPLKDWDINIYRGVLTGYNDAFIISGEKRQELLNNCKSPAERKRTDELIRPILRGRDIQRYSYEYANLYLIATFPSRHYNIDDYPSVKNYLLSFGMERLEQTGKKYKKNGEEIRARKKTNNKWFETQDSISYWDDFNQPVIAWQRITAKNQFCLTKKETVILDSMAFLSNLGKYEKFLLAILNSNLIYYWVKKNVHEYGDSGFRLSNQYVEQITIPKPSEKDLNMFNELVDGYFSKTVSLEEIDCKVYELYNLTSNDIEIIERVIEK